MKRSLKSAVVLILGCISIFAPSPARAQESVRAVGPPAQHLTLDGVENFARISDVLYRGAQPKSFAYNELKNIGVSIVVDFRDEKDEIASEKRDVENTGMQFISLPWHASHGPVNDEIASFLNTVRENPGKKIFVHCKHGADRTGVMVALYRITFDHWTPAQAVAEMHTFHYHEFLLPNLERFVSAYPVPVANEAAATPATQATRNSH